MAIPQKLKYVQIISLLFVGQEKLSSKPEDLEKVVFNNLVFYFNPDSPV